MPNHERLTAWMLASIVVGFGFLVVMPLIAKPREFMEYLGFAPDRSGTALAWILATAVTAQYAWGAAKIPSVREHMFRPTPLKLLAVIAALMAGIVEEVIFRRWVMDYLEDHAAHTTLQVLGSGAAFGLAHAVWGLLGRSLDAAIHAMIATGLLGVGLAVVYLVGGRSLAPCIAAHFIITALIEPGLVLAGMRGELGLHAKQA